MIAVSASLFLSCKDNKENEVVISTYSENEDIENLSSLDTIKITLNSNDRMQFDTAEINVYSGQTVILTLHHTGTMPLSAMGHNFVLLEKGTSTSEFAKRAMNAKDNEYIPVDEKDVLAYTGLIGGGVSTTITFSAPEKGSYDFLCSFPGHYAIMKGKFNVK